MGTGFAKKKKQAKEMQNKILEMQDKMKTAEVIGTAGNGLVTITLTSNEIKDIKIKPECVDPEDIEGLEDLIKAAYKDASQKLESETKLPDMPGMGGFPGFF